MEVIHDPGQSSVSWVAKLVEVLQPLSVRANRLGAMELFAGLGWSELESAADLFIDADIARGTRMTVQGQPNETLTLILQGEALVSADARPIRVAGGGSAVGVTSMLHGTRSLETTIALTPIRALCAGRQQFEELVSNPGIRRRLTAVAGDQLRERRASVGKSLTDHPGNRSTRRSRPPA